MLYQSLCKSVTGAVCLDVLVYIYDPNAVWNAYYVEQNKYFNFLIKSFLKNLFL